MGVAQSAVNLHSTQTNLREEHMKRFKLVKLVALAVLAAAGIAFAQENRIQNAGFEDGVLDPWSVYRRRRRAPHR